MSDLIRREDVLGLVKDICISFKDCVYYKHMGIDPSDVMNIPSINIEEDDLISRKYLTDWLTSTIISLKGVCGDLGGIVNGVREMVKTMPSAVLNNQIDEEENGNSTRIN